MQSRPRRSQGSSRPESSPNVTSAIGMEETVGHLRTRRQTLFARTVLWIIGLVCTALLLATIAQAWSNNLLTAQLQQEQQKLQQLQDRNTSLKNDVDKYKDPVVIEREAREKMGYARPGEQVVMIVGSGDHQQQQTKKQPEPQPSQGFWDDWWRVFFGGSS